MFCTKCGKKLFDEAVICPQCGTQTANYVAPVQQQPETNQNPTLQRAPDEKISYCVGEIVGKFTLNPISVYADLYFDENELVIDSYSAKTKIHICTLRAPYNDISFRTETVKMMLINKVNVLIIKSKDFAISAYVLDGFLGNQATSLSEQINEYTTTRSKLERFERILREKTGGQQ